MLTKYTGELLISPIPLELSMNYCSHKCAYCFANLNNPSRTFNAKDTINAISKAHSSNTLVSTLLREKYPVLISNLVDPFAKSNYKATIAISEILTEMDIPISWQTRGGDGIDEVLQIIKSPQSWYISIPYINETLRELLEPGATTIKSRFDLIEKLKSYGHNVAVGINPVTKEWTPEKDFQSLLNALKRLGVFDVWIQGLHLNAAQEKQMTPRERINMTQKVLDDAKKKDDTIQGYVRSLVDIAFNKGFNPYFPGMPMYSEYIENVSKPYKKRFKTNHEFINHVIKTKKDGDFVRFGEYYDFIKNDIFEAEFSTSDVDGYAYRIARNTYSKTVTSPFRRIKNVIYWYWDNMVNRSLLVNPLIKIACWADEDKIIPYLCTESKSYIGVYCPNGDESNYVII